MDIEEELRIIKRNVVEILPGMKELRQKLQEVRSQGRPLKIKYGVDPTAPDIHLGHTVVLWKLRQFQDLGHIVQFIIGDFTAMIGDPSGRNETRKLLTKEIIAENAKTYLDQVFKILDRNKTQVFSNSEWFSSMDFSDFLKMASHYTVARVLERAEFKERFKKKQEISLLEFIYPLLQGYDSVILENDIEIGGTDQKFNLLIGRNLQRDYGKKEQIIITMPLLEGTDGVQKMSKSYNNYIGITESPKNIYGKTMSIPDKLIFPYMELLTLVSENKIADLKKKIKNKTMNPKDVKAFLASELVAIYYSREESERAAQEFNKVFSRRDFPTEMPVLEIDRKKIWVVELLILSKFAKSKTDANRLILQRGVEVDGKTIETPDFDLSLDAEHILKVGKYRFLKVKGGHTSEK